ncbi:MAG: DUF362 domain-containing protein [Clostridia bacterium]|nr:DUF362 domain-containing protein [Clostridia bacterium]
MDKQQKDIYVIYGDRSAEMARAVLTAMDIAAELKALGKEKPLIGLKPNLVVAQPSEWGATTCPQLVRGVIGYLKEHGFDNLIILESAWVGDCTHRAFQVCGYQDISRDLQVPLIDLKKDEAVQVEVEGLKFGVCRQALAVDYLINLPVLKAHCQTKLTCALKNLKGCIPDSEKRRFHTLGLHRPIAYLNKALTAHLTIVDGIIGDLTFEEGGTPVRMNRVIAGRDPVLVDCYAAELLGYRIEDIPYIKLAAHLGVGSTDLTEDRVIELNSKREAGVPEPALSSDTVDYLKQWIIEDQACSACYGSLIHALMRLKDQGKLAKLKEKVYIGQGFKEKKPKQQDQPAQGDQWDNLGMGQCTGGFPRHVPGCPPRASQIIKYLLKT